jgi:hypothetical protein
MTSDLSAVWDSFATDLDVEIKRINTATSQTFTEVHRIASSARQNVSRATNNTGSAMRTFASNLMHREHLTRSGVQLATETFESKLSSLRADALSSVRSAFIGRLMEDTYHAANMEYGKPNTTTNTNLTLKSLLTTLTRHRQRPPAKNSHHAYIQLHSPVRRPSPHLQREVQNPRARNARKIG